MRERHSVSQVGTAIFVLGLLVGGLSWWVARGEAPALRTHRGRGAGICRSEGELDVHHELAAVELADFVVCSYAADGVGSTEEDGAGRTSAPIAASAGPPAHPPALRRECPWQPAITEPPPPEIYFREIRGPPAPRA